MANNDLLVPGTSGCKLMANGVDIGWPGVLTAEAWLGGVTRISARFDVLGLTFSSDEIRDLLSMEFADATSPRPTKTCLATGKSIAPGERLLSVYNQFTDFQPFTYDWRSDVRDSGRLLLDRLKNKPANAKWRIAAHSQGGLAVVVASKLFALENGDDDTAFSQLVSHVCFIATPFHGTLTAATAILLGDTLSAPFSDTFKKVVRTWPAIHQMLPVWPGCVRSKGPAGETRMPFNLMDDQAWAGENVSADMLKRARDTRAAFLRNPISRMKGVNILACFSKAWPTANCLVLDGRLTVAPPDDDEAGDTLVPQETVVSMSTAIEKERFLIFGENQDTMKHFALAIDPFVATEVRSFFGQ
jgi:hypothetical protein